MIPVALVSGFLGTGKTTLLRRIIDQSRHQSLVYLVNEFSPRDVDGTMLARDDAHVIAIPGGSIFCKCLVSEFISQLQRIADDFGDREGLVIEASGMADPRVIVQMLAETGLERHFQLCRILSVVSPDSFLRLRHTLPNILAQVAAADLILINKTDCSSMEQVMETEMEITRVNPRAEIIRTIRCACDIDLFPAFSGTREQLGQFAECRDARFESFETHGKSDKEALTQFIEANEASIFRVKGWVGGHEFQYSTSGYAIGDEVSGSGEHIHDTLVWIVSENAKPILQAQLAMALPHVIPVPEESIP